MERVKTTANMGLRSSRASVSYAKPNPHCRVGCHRKLVAGIQNTQN
ncbi:MAG: hypothetical protein F6K26_36045 [Moorea sp. SIO2I5]|nr:hypothetical protein [Moorena sp. SIO2I5]